MLKGVGIPLRMLYEAMGFVVTVELKSGDLYRGSLFNCEDNWNVHLYDITFTSKDGKVSQLENAYIRGNNVRLMIIPDILKNAPIFERLKSSRIKGKMSTFRGDGRQSAVAIHKRAQAAGRGAATGGRGRVRPPATGGGGRVRPPATDGRDSVLPPATGGRGSVHPPEWRMPIYGQELFLPIP